LLAAADAFLLTSISEGIPVTLIEAMSARLPIVATRVGGNAELLESGMNGLLVPPASPDALAEALLAYFSDPATARRHAKAARHAAEARFSLARMVADYGGLYERTLAAAGVLVPPAAEAMSTR
jgi:glycosyltransferase involved in cell wall biosynthesis